MKRRIAGLALLLTGVIAGIFLIARMRDGLPVTVILRIAVIPNEKLDFVLRQARSARFKYLVGKKSGVKPILAERLALMAVPNTSLLEAQVGVRTKTDGQRYADAFLEVLQAECGKQAQLSLSSQSVR